MEGLRLGVAAPLPRDAPQALECRADAPPVLQFLEDGQALLEQTGSPVVFALQEIEDAGPGERLGVEGRRRTAAPGERALQPLASLPVVAAHAAELPQGAGQPQARLGLLSQRPPDRGPQVVELGLQAGQPPPLPRAGEPGFGTLGEVQKESRVTPSCTCRFTRLLRAAPARTP